jgi:DNA-binding beta-propeller fold protein YncE
VVTIVLSAGEDVSVTTPVRAGLPPLRIAASSDEVWVTSERDSALTPLDPETGEPSLVPILFPFHISGVALGRGAVWVSVPSQGAVLKVSPEDGRVLRRIEVGGRPGPIVYGGGRVWVADEDGAGITAINARGGNLVYARGIVPRSAPLRLAVGAGGLWVSSASTGTVRRIDLSTVRPDPPIAVGRGPAGVTVAHGYVWVANSRSGTVSRVDPSIHAVVGDPIDVGGRPGGIDSGTGLVWVANSLDDTVLRLDIDGGGEVGSPIHVGPDPGAVAVGGAAVWVANNGDGTVTRIEP